ncbi:MAG: MgtC/SapB family protein [Oscillatoriales cyanobacterium]|nr:MAG: MgtC/SapB family protein [Oscillatoriales cyanobacterium]
MPLPLDHKWLDLLTRLGLAILVGATIGIDRQLRHKPAGIRTHMLVSIGAALFALIPLELGASIEAVSRSIQGVATGVGFLGAGEILRQKGKTEKVKGLTSAAAIWVAAALGFAAGCGLWALATWGSLLVFLVLRLNGLERRLARHANLVNPDPSHEAIDDD